MWKFLSYKLTKDLTAYKDGKRILINTEKDLKCGDSCNQTSIELSSHLGTHIDFPFHFNSNGKKGDEYSAKELIFNKIDLCVFEDEIDKNDLISKKHFKNHIFNKYTEFFIIKTGFCSKRFEDSYHNGYPGFSPKLAYFFRKEMPGIRAIGFDLISLSSPINGEAGKKAHIEFLKKENILIVEDMNLNNLDNKCNVTQLIISPLRFEESDGAPVTIFAKFN